MSAVPRAHRPALTRRRRRLYLLVAAVVTLGVATALVLSAFRDSLVFFYSPTDLAIRTDIPGDRVIRIGGLVEQGSLRRAAGGTEVRFVVTDLRHRIEVAYRGILPDLFREGQGVVSQGRMGKDGVFHANQVLAKHDETYMPKEVADALKKSGRWQERSGAPHPGTGPGTAPGTAPAGGAAKP